MIEPQNTMLPFAPQTTAKESSSGDLGFGEMLAHTLGMIPRFDASALSGINPDQSQGNGHGQGEPMTDDSDLKDDGRWVVSPAVPVVNQGYAAPTVANDTVVVGVSPAPEAVPVRSAGELAPEQPVVDTSMPVVGDSIAPPVLDDQVTASVVSEAAGHTSPAAAVAPDDGQPVLVPVAADPVEPDPEPEPPVGELEPVPDSAPAPADDPRPPIGTAPAGARHIDPAELKAVSAGPADTIPAPAVPTPPTATATQNRPTHGADSSPVAPVQNERVAVADTTRVTLQEGRVELESGPTPVQTATPALSPEHLAGRAAPVGSSVNQIAPSQHTALAERILETVELQANQPPPRTVIVDIPEIEGLRLVVSVRSGGEVHVVPSSTSTAPAGLSGFMSELDAVLADRGFVMTGDGRRRGGNPQPEDQRELPRRPRPTANRPLDNDLRI